ncbi:MAG: leucine-rich repeat protein [Lachnospiraceae bacterium]|nr:leucine-rich repeat protein [Lachnospiraceae bacterium]
MTYRRLIVLFLTVACLFLMSACGTAALSTGGEDPSVPHPTVPVTAESSTAGAEEPGTTESAAGLVEFVSFRADTTEIHVDQPARVTFFAEVTENSLVGDAIVIECETDGVIAELKDDGVKPDQTAGDRVFTAAIDLQSADRKNEYYRAACQSDHSDAVQICFYRDLTQKDFDQMESVLDRIDEMNEFSQIASYLSDCPDIEWVGEDEENGSITFTTTAGITGVWDKWDENSKGGGTADVPGSDAASEDETKAASIVQTELKRDILVIRPYRHGDPKFDYDDFLDRGNDIARRLGGSVDHFDNAFANRSVMKSFAGYGIILFDSHGITAKGLKKSLKWDDNYSDNELYLVIGESMRYDETSQADWQAKRILVHASTRAVCVGAKFFDDYYAAGDLKNAFIFLGCCHCVKNDSITDVLISKGASVIFGYNNVVGFPYCKNTLNEVVRAMTLDGATAGEAYDLAVDKCGDLVFKNDPEHLLTTRLQIKGDLDFHFDPRVRVSVRDKNGDPVPEASVNLLKTDSWDVYQADAVFINSIPYFETYVPMGEYAITVTAEHYLKEEMVVQVPEDMLANCLEVTLTRLGELECCVLDKSAGGVPLSGVTLTLIHNGEIVAAESDENGRIFVQDLKEGHYSLEFSLEGYKTVKVDDLLIEYDKLTELPDPVEMIKEGSQLRPEVGDLVEFGHYEQDNDPENGPEVIQWRVLDVVDGKALLVSRTCLAAQPYNEVYTDITWEQCTLRKWLNEDFLKEAFSAEEQEDIILSCVKNDDNPQSHKPGGNDTTDKVFLLSITEAEAYFDSDAARMCLPSRYALKQQPKMPVENGGCWWWLRSPGGTTKYAVDVMPNGSIRTISGANVNVIYWAVRPALWLDLETSEYQTIKGHTSWKVEGHVLTISGTGAMEDYDGETLFAPWYSMGNTITTIVIEDGITHIGSHAFDFIWATSVSIPDSVTSIGDGAFKTCFRLKKVTIPEGVTYIGNEAFSGCTDMEELILPDSVIFMGKEAFASCQKLTSLDIPDRLTVISERAFADCRGLTSLVIPDGICSIGAYAFWYCSGLTEVSIPGSVEEIGGKAFAYCTGLTAVIVPEGVVSLGESAFSNCTQLAVLSLPLSLKKIGMSALINCTALKDINYAGSEENWKEIEIERYNKDIINAATIHYNN